jgi:hypothetical protein
MAKQTVTLRLDEDDLTWLAQAELPGASNLSEKVRALLAAARDQQAGIGDYGAAYDFCRRLFAGAERALRQAEVDSQQRSELIARTLAWLPEAAAFVLAGLSDRDEDPVAALRRFERGLGERLIGLTDSVLQLAQAGFPGCYAPGELVQRARSAVASTAAASAVVGGTHATTGH